MKSLAAIALLAAVHVPALAQAAAPVAAPGLMQLQQRDAKLFATGWRLVTGNARYCEGAAPAIGVLLHDAHAYGDPEAVRAQLGLSGDISVQAVAPGSPAERAGVAANDTLVSIEGRNVATAFPRGIPRWQRLIDIDAALNAALSDGKTELQMARTGAAAVRLGLEGTPACPTRFEVLDTGSRAVADGARVIFGRNFTGFGFPEDEFAAAVAHELAHNLLGHRERLDRDGRKRSLVRLTERDADRLTPWLLYNAGYDPRAAARFMRRWGPRYSHGIFRKRTHDGWDERVEFIETEIAWLEGVVEEHGAADWSRHFRREADGQVRPAAPGG
ncbi:MAG: PDZ domain-containing protein [Qipengyuania sp.]